jgi:hypothetical protein
MKRIMSVTAVLALAMASNAGAWTPFHSGAAARFGPSLPKDPPPSTSSGSTPAAQAPSTRKASVEKLDQSQSGLLNQQTVDTGNVRQTGKSEQSQSGALSRQLRIVGTENSGGKADVATKDVNQLQRGMVNDQKVSVGNAGQ